MSRFLVTTALEETWRDDEPVVFLGEWCRSYSRKARWSALDAEVLPYHWDDRAQLQAAYRPLLDLYERLLQELTDHLNQTHRVDHGLRYWRILIGPWLGYFTQTLFDRWISIHSAVCRYELSGTVVLDGHDQLLVPNDMADFNRLYVTDDWNHDCYATILQQHTTVPCTKIMRLQAPERESKDKPRNNEWKPWIKGTLTTAYGLTVGRLSRDRDAFLLQTYLPRRDEMRLYRRLGQLPHPWRSAPPVRVAVDFLQRQWRLSGEDRSEFESCARATIPKQIPTAYLEGYRKLLGQAAGMPWPKKPRFIWTSNAASADDVFKAWAAEKVEEGSPLVIGQHGGHYGMGRWSFLEDHEVAISDSYLSWGWAETGQPKVKPVGQLKAKRPLRVRHAEQPGALLVTTTVPRQSVAMFSAMVSRQWLDYFNDQCAFVGALPLHIRRALTVRLYTQDDGWDQFARWKERLPDVRLDDGRSSITKLVRRSRLYVSTYNATTYLESFTMDVPTVIYWNPNHWELRDSAIPYFEDLKRVGIFHETPEAAARHVAAIWDDVDAWWTSPAVREVLGHFKERYCRLPDDLIARLADALRAVQTDASAVRQSVITPTTGSPGVQ